MVGRLAAKVGQISAHASSSAPLPSRCETGPLDVLGGCPSGMRCVAMGSGCARGARGVFVHPNHDTRTRHQFPPGGRGVGVRRGGRAGGVPFAGHHRPPSRGTTDRHVGAGHPSQWGGRHASAVPLLRRQHGEPRRRSNHGRVCRFWWRVRGPQRADHQGHPGRGFRVGQPLFGRDQQQRRSRPSDRAQPSV